MTRGAEILGIGLVCAVGLRARFAAAAVRAGLARFRESTHFDRRGQPLILASVPEDRLPPLASQATGLTDHETRIARLALAAAGEALQHVRKDNHHPTLRPFPLVLGLPGPEPVPTLRIDPVVRAILAALVPAGDPARCSVHANGRASGLVALADALTHIDQGAPMALALAADSFDEPNLLAALDREDRLRADGVYDGFTPGEAGAAVLLGAPGLGARLGLPVLAKLAGTSVGEEPGHRYSEEPHRGDGLAAVIRTLLAGHPDLQVGSVFAALNGESLFAKEWGVAAIRNHAHLPDHCRLEHPADCLGDTGAASGLLLTALAANQVHHRQVRGPSLIWAAADHAPRAAALLV